MDDLEYDEEYPESYIFAGCTCDHTEDDHGWGQCDIEGCDCQGGWEE